MFVTPFLIVLINPEENDIMNNVKSSLLSIELMPAPSENEMIEILRDWRTNPNISTRLDACINGYGRVTSVCISYVLWIL